MDLINPLVQSYAEKYSSPEDALLQEIAEYTTHQHSEPHMLSGHLQGKLLEMVSHMIKPRRILEIGTFTGYSALCLAKGLQQDGVLHTIELREKDAAIARAYFDRSVYQDQIILHNGTAKDIIPTLTETWDLVFIDADKVSYTEYLELVLPDLRQNGFILADNIFFHGEVLTEPVKGKSAKAIQAFNEAVMKRDDIDKMIITLRDGLYLLRKL
ncbi:O-methyltransferase [Terrimonas sp. NA20]|uniref:O-methyltransferase n=1 Tax=Terrimonas ginsenosidimutans TaxID=2908004 RepID=A0ABS9KVQ5_9BACT|nr:O-methyltransferase [Terrimonas ginsenosidimutans]